MQSVRNVTKERLSAGKVALGLGVRSSGEVMLAHVAACAGLHYLYIDLEHNQMSIDATRNLCVAALGVGVTPIVRLSLDSASEATRILDGGAQGIIVPHVDSGAAAREVVRRFRFPSQGERSLLGPTVHVGWKKMPAADLMAELDRQTLVVIVLESVKSIENIDEIAACEGIDTLIVGTSDLAADMGIPGQLEHPRILEAYGKVIAAAKRNSKSLRLGGVYTQPAFGRNIELGSRMLTIGYDTDFMIAGVNGKTADIMSMLDKTLMT